MDASEADDTGAQLLGLDVPAKPVLTARTALPSLVGQGYGDPCNKTTDGNSAKGLFDVYEDLGKTGTDAPGGAGALGILPSTAAVFDMAASDLDRKDDATPLAAEPCATLPCLVGQGYGDPCTDVKVEVIKQFQDDMSTPVGPQPRATWADVSDNDLDFTGFGYPEDLADDATAEVDSLGLLAHDGPLAFRDHARKTQADITVPGGFTVAPKDSPQTLRTQYGPLPSDGFLDHARLMLPDVYPDSCEEELAPDGVEEDDVDDASVPDTLAQHAPQEQKLNSLQPLQTQCGHLPQQHLPSPCAPGLSHATNLPGETLDFEGFTIFDLDEEGCLASCGPLPQLQHQTPQTQDSGSLDHDLGTQCGCLPQPSGGTLEDTLDDLKNTLASLVTAASSGASIADRMALLAQYQAATHRFELWDQAQTQSSSLSTSLRTQCGPLPQAATSCSKDFNSKTMPTPRTQYGPLPRPQPDLPASVTPRTQSEPSPQTHHYPSSGALLQGADSTQCGPLPQQQTSVPLEFGPSVTQSAADAMSKGRKRRGKRGKRI